jgi:CheY-like chemotaxis protein
MKHKWRSDHNPQRAFAMSRFKLKVLVTDDSPVIHDVFAEFAKDSPIPFELVSARSGQECMDILASGRINVAFIDVSMPEMSGMEALSAARRVGDKTFTVLMSAAATKIRMQLARQLKVYEFLAKPFRAHDVLAILQTYCRVIVPSRALIVDDSATVRQIIRRVLANSIFDIAPTEAADGETAFACCYHGRFDVVFLDCNMPGIDGLQTLARLIDRDPDVKVIMMSGEHGEAWRGRALDLGAKAFLQKPFVPADIDRELHAIFGLRTPVLAGVEPMRFGRAEAETAPPHWSAA